MTDARDIEQAKADLESDQVCCITWVERHADKLLTDNASLRKQLEDARYPAELALRTADGYIRSLDVSDETLANIIKRDDVLHGITVALSALKGKS